MSSNEFADAEIPMYTVELVRDRTIPFKKLNKLADAHQILHQILDKSPVERFIALYVNLNNDIVGAETVAIGSLDMVQVPIRELFRGAIVAGVTKVIVAHNHAVGDAYPSVQDLFVTALVVNVGAVLGIRVLDHIVTAPDGKHYSILAKENAKEVDDRINVALLDQALAALNVKNGIGRLLPSF